MEKHIHDTVIEAPQEFPTETAGLPEARPTELVELSDGAEFDLEIAPVKKTIRDTTVRMLAYNGSIPGPTLKVEQDSSVIVNVTNHGDLDATVHWHGLRLENRYDGTLETQPPIPVGGTFSYRLDFPDPGLYWYHPHIRQDYGQEMGLYANIVVVPADPDYWPPVNREVVLTLDDILVVEGKIAPFNREETTFSAMGRYGNAMLVNGETDVVLDMRLGEVVRFYLTNTANSRVFKVALPGARMKLIGGDSGRYERQEFVDKVILAPSERVIVDVLFDSPGELTLEHRSSDRTYSLARIGIADETLETSAAGEFNKLRSAPELEAERAQLRDYVATEADKTLALVAEMDLRGPEVQEAVAYACPMHPEIVASWAGNCPKCGMKLLPREADVPLPTEYVCPMHPEITATWAATCPKCGMTLRVTGAGRHGTGEEHAHATMHADSAAHHGHGHGTNEGIEWEDEMVDVNRLTTPANMHWKLVDRATGAEGHAIDWQFRVGDRVKIRLVNEMDSDHPMHHPFHIHGAGRFLVLARDEIVEPNLVWKDTVLVRTGETVDILLDVTNPGRWMAHCHIAEHHESGMMFSFDVTSGDGSPAAVNV